MALSTKQLLAIAALNQGRTQAQAAAAASAGLRTVERWMTQQEFREAIRQAKRETYDQAITRTVACSSLAVTVLGNIAADNKVGASARVAACKTILDVAFKAHAQEELEQRVVELEEKLKP